VVNNTNKANLVGVLVESVVENLLLLQEKPTRIDLEKFSKLTPQEQILVAKKTLRQVGQGSSRNVFLMPGGKTVLKIASSPAGKGQNQAEASASDFTQGSFLARVIHRDQGYQWLVSEYAKPLEDDSAFRKLTGGEGLKPLIADMENWYNYAVLRDRDQWATKGFQKIEALRKTNRWVDSFLKFIRVGDIQPGDFEGLHQWGMVGDNRLVVLDYGFSRKVANKHYEEE